MGMEWHRIQSKVSHGSFPAVDWRSPSEPHDQIQLINLYSTECSHRCLYWLLSLPMRCQGGWGSSKSVPESTNLRLILGTWKAAEPWSHPRVTESEFLGLGIWNLSFQEEPASFISRDTLSALMHPHVRSDANFPFILSHWPILHPWSPSHQSHLLAAWALFPVSLLMWVQFWVDLSESQNLNVNSFLTKKTTRCQGPLFFLSCE